MSTSPVEHETLKTVLRLGLLMNFRHNKLGFLYCLFFKNRKNHCKKNFISFLQCVRNITVGVMAVRKKQKSLVELEKPGKL
jgi:hypothetical protein